MSQLKKDTRLTLLSRVPVMLLSFISVVLLTRLLGPEGNGVYTFIYAGLNLFITIFGFQLDSSLTYFLSNQQYDNEKVRSSIALFAFVSVFLLAFTLCLITFIVPGGSTLFIPEGQPVFFFSAFIVISFILRSASNLIQASLRGMFQFRTFNLYLLISQLIPVIVYLTLFLFIIWDKLYLQTSEYFKIILVTESILCLIGIYLLFQSNQIRFSKDSKTYSRSILHYSSKNLLGTIGHFFNKRLDVWFVEFYKGLATLGQYGLATQIGNFISEALTPFNQVLFPYISGSNADQHKGMVGRIARLNLYISIIAAIIIMSTSWIFIPILFGHKFDEAIPATQILAIGIIFISQRLVFTNYFKATNQLKYNIQASWGGVIITVILDFLLIPAYGIIGASIASIIAYGVTAGFLIFSASSKMNMSLMDTILLKKEDVTWLFHKHEDLPESEI